MLQLVERLVKVRMTLTVDVNVLGIKGELAISGPRDEDRDGAPEFLVALTGPGLSIPPMPLEIPQSILSGTIAGIVAFVVGKVTRQG